MDRAYVISIGAILHLELPVAVVDVRGVTAQHLDPVGCSIGDLIDDRLCAAEMLHERHDVGIEASEQKSAIALEARHLRQVSASPAS